jgi:hypothetical protein
MKNLFAGLIAVLAGTALTQAQTISNPWSGVSGDKGNMSAFAFQANAGTYPASINPTGSLTAEFSLDSLTLTRPNDTTTPVFGTGLRQLASADTPVFIDIYTSLSAGVFSGYLGSSTSSVLWSGTTADQPFTFNFTGITLQSSSKYWLVFSEDNVDGDISNFRAKLNTSGDNLTPGPGKGYLINDTSQALTQANAEQDWAFAYSVSFMPIPEPSVLSLGLLGLVVLARRRR